MKTCLRALVVVGALLGSTSVEAAVTFRSRSAVVNTSGTSPTPTEPSGCANGDYVVALYGTSGTTGNPTLPTGWTTLYPRTASGTAFQFIVGGIQRSASAPSYAFTQTGSLYRELHVICYQGAATITLDSQSSSGTAAAAVDHNPDPPSTTPVASSSRAIAFFANWWGSSPSWGASSGYAIDADNSALNSMSIESKALASATPENPGVVTGLQGGGGVQNYWDGGTITLTDAGGVVTPGCKNGLLLLGVGCEDTR